jgi:hypothetical protein
MNREKKATSWRLLIHITVFLLNSSDLNHIIFYRVLEKLIIVVFLVGEFTSPTEDRPLADLEHQQEVMKNSSEDTPTASRTLENDGPTVSRRKVAANRQNALKSTGPKTAKGKAFSQRNAWKHGLFARQTMDFIAHGEDPVEYHRLLEGFREQFHPSGCAEELEVERITQSWWRLKRAYRYENAMNGKDQREVVQRKLAEDDRCYKPLEENEKAVLQLLESSRDEIRFAGQISQELRTKVFALMPESQARWPDLERLAERAMNQSVLSKIKAKPDQRRNASVKALLTVDIFIEEIGESAKLRNAFLTELAVAQHVIPMSDALDKILRYETSIERSLSRALERLERMRRTRLGENGPCVPK